MERASTGSAWMDASVPDFPALDRSERADATTAARTDSATSTASVPGASSATANEPSTTPGSRPASASSTPRRSMAWRSRAATATLSGITAITIVPGTNAWSTMVRTGAAIMPMPSPSVPCTADPTKTIATHTQLGAPPCNFYVMSNKPCPACGMTTSFALLVRGDVAASLRANWAGTLIAVLWAGLMVWAAASGVKGRPLFIPRGQGELVLTLTVGVVLALMLTRWGIVLIRGQ